MTKKGFLITFSGMDGAGKSTQISILKNTIKSNGQRCFVLWARGGYTNNFEFLKKVIRFFLINTFLLRVKIKIGLRLWLIP